MDYSRYVRLARAAKHPRKAQVALARFRAMKSTLEGIRLDKTAVCGAAASRLNSAVAFAVTGARGVNSVGAWWEWKGKLLLEKRATWESEARQRAFWAALWGLFPTEVSAPKHTESRLRD